MRHGQGQVEYKGRITGAARPQKVDTRLHAAHVTRVLEPAAKRRKVESVIGGVAVCVGVRPTVSARRVRKPVDGLRESGRCIEIILAIPFDVVAGLPQGGKEARLMRPE